MYIYMLAWPCNLSPMFCRVGSALNLVKSFRAAFESTDFVGFFLWVRRLYLVVRLLFALLMWLSGRLAQTCTEVHGKMLIAAWESSW
jgi:hypothetical protein